MSVIDRYNDLHGQADERLVCTRCFSDEDIISFIKKHKIGKGCDFCDSKNRPVAKITDVAQMIHGILNANYSLAVNELPYESREGGYQASNYDTQELLMDEIGIDLPMDYDQKLENAMVNEIGEDQWCAFDWTALDPDQSLRFSWDQFCEAVKHERRFFFHHLGKSKYDGPDTRSFLELFDQIVGLITRQKLIVTEPAGLTLFRARPCKPKEKFTTAKQLGSPPTKYATQSNRMNPPGIPMFYGSETKTLALKEVGTSKASIGTFETLRPCRILDLVNLPMIPGFFSSCPRTRRHYIRFMHQFGGMIAKPVARDNQVHINYIPTQVFTEFLRDFKFKNGPIDGVRFASAAGKGSNVVLFVTQSNFLDIPETNKTSWNKPDRWIKMVSVSQT